jgi:hypothetical protein
MFTNPRRPARNQRATIRAAGRNPFGITDNSDEPRLSAVDAARLTGPDGERLAAVVPLIRPGRREQRRLARELEAGRPAYQLGGWDGAA